MTAKKIPTVIAVTLGMWIAALGSAAALSYNLNRPLSVRGTTLPVEAPGNPTQVVPAELLSEDVQPVLYLPPLTIVGRYRPTVAAPVPKTVEGLAVEQCADWRELEMGSGRVQLCE